MRKLSLPKPARTRRAMALVTTIIFCATALTLAAALTAQIYTDTHNITLETDAQAAEQHAKETLAAFEHQLAQDPDFFYTETFWAERPRYCLASTQYVMPGTAGKNATTWPTSCGTSWRYPEQGEEVPGDTPRAANATARAEITPPTTTDPNLKVEIRTRVRATSHTVTAKYDRPTPALLRSNTHKENRTDFLPTGPWQSIETSYTNTTTNCTTNGCPNW